MAAQIPVTAELRDPKTPAERLEVLQDALRRARELLAFCDQNNIGTFKTDAGKSSMIYTPRLTE